MEERAEQLAGRLPRVDCDLAGIQISQSESAFAAELLVAHFDGGAGLHSPSIVAPPTAEKSGPALVPLGISGTLTAICVIGESPKKQYFSAVFERIKRSNPAVRTISFLIRVS